MRARADNSLYVIDLVKRVTPVRIKTLAIVKAFLDLREVTRSLSRPRVSNDNPYSEARFKTVKYRHDYPDRFHSLEEVRSWMAPFVDWYNREHYHLGVGYQHPATLHGGEALETLQARQETLDAAYSVWSERFRNGPPRAARPRRRGPTNPSLQQPPDLDRLGEVDSFRQRHRPHRSSVSNRGA